MIVGDLIYNDDFDCDCNYARYDGSDGKQYEDGAKLLFSTKRDGFCKPLNWILDLKIKYITIHNSVIVIEATR